MQKITAYKCDNCKKVTVTKQGMKKHEAKCFWNPDTKSCMTCDNFTPDDYEAPRLCSRGMDLQKGLNTGCPSYKIDPVLIF